MLRHVRVLALLTAFAAFPLAGCVETAVVQRPATAADGEPAAAPAAPAPGTTLQIADVVFASRSITASEAFSVSFKVKAPGSGKLVAYWLATRLGEARYPIKTPLPVIANGWAELTYVGPLPNQREAGKFDVAFWVEDELGAMSNRLTKDLLVQ